MSAQLNPPPLNEYVLDLTHRLQEALKHDLFFALALYEQSNEVEFDILESLVGLVNARRSEQMDDDSRNHFEYLKHTDRSRGGSKEVTAARRLFKVRDVT